jgi:hypothetical protein
MNIKILLLLILPILLMAGQYEGKYKYFLKKEILYQDEIPAEVSSVNFMYLGNYVDNDYVILFKKDGGGIRQRLVTKIRRNEEKIQKNLDAIAQLKYNKNFSPEEKYIEKKVYLDSNKEWRQQIEDAKGALNLLSKNTKYGIKYTGYVVDIYPLRGTILIKGTPVFATVDTSIARMKIKVSEEDYKNIDFKTVKRNNTIINPKFIKKAKKDKKNKGNYIYIYLAKPSKYEINKHYKITIY